MKIVKFIIAVSSIIISLVAYAESEVSKIKKIESVYSNILLCSFMTERASEDKDMEWIIYEQDIMDSRRALQRIDNYLQSELSDKDYKKVGLVGGTRSINASLYRKRELSKMTTADRKKATTEDLEYCRNIWAGLLGM